MPSHRYYLPCSCGQKHIVDAGLAGSTITCSCGKTLDVPTLRGLRSLEPYTEPAPPQAASRPLGCLFVACLATTLIALAVVGGALFFLRDLDTSYTIEMDLEEGVAVIDGMSINETYEVWKVLNQQGLPTPERPQFIKNLIAAQRLRTVATVAGTIAALGLIATVVTWIADSRRK